MSAPNRDDPSEDLLFVMLEELDARKPYVVVERLDVASPSTTFMGVTRLSRRTFRIDYQEGPDSPSVRAVFRDLREAHEVLTRLGGLLSAREPRLNCVKSRALTLQCRLHPGQVGVEPSGPNRSDHQRVEQRHAGIGKPCQQTPGTRGVH